MGFDSYIVSGRSGENEQEQQGSHRQVSPKKVMENAAVAHMLQTLEQLVDVRSFATEMFFNLQKEAEKANARIKNVRSRIQELSRRVPEVEKMCHQSSPQSFYNAPLASKLARNDNPPNGLFNPPRHDAVKRRRDESAEVAPLVNMNKYAACLDWKPIKKKLGKEKQPLDPSKPQVLACEKLYSNPLFFYEMWVEAEMEKLRIKKQNKQKRRKKKKHRKPRDTVKKIEALEVTYIDELGIKRVRKKGGVIQQQERDLGRSGNVTTNTVGYGAQANFNVDWGKQRAQSAHVPQPYDPNEPKPVQPAPQHPGAPPVAPQPGHAAPQPAPYAPPAPQPGYSQPAPAVPPSPQQGYAPPPTPHQQQGYAPPPSPQQGYAQPQQGYAPPPQPQQGYAPPVPPTPAAPPKPQMPEYLERFAKMVKIGLPEPSVKGAMRKEGIDEDLYWTWLDPKGPKGAGASPPPGPGAPPPGPGAAPPRAPGRGGLLGAIQSGTKLRSAPAQPRPAAGAGGLLGAIRAGATLKSAQDRVLAPAPKVVDQRGDLMSQLRGGVALKSAKKRKMRKPKVEEDQSNNIFALMKMRDLIADSDEEDSDEEWSS